MFFKCISFNLFERNILLCPIRQNITVKHLRNIKDLICAIIDWFYQPFRNYVPADTFRYGVSGGFNTSLDLFLYFICYNYVVQKKVVHLPFVAVSPHIFSFLVVFPITFTTGFILSKYIAFSDSYLHSRVQLFRYGVTVLVCVILKYLLLKLFVDGCHIYPTPSNIIATVVTIAYSYFSQKYFTFKTEKSVVSGNE